MKFTEDCLAQIATLKANLAKADAIVVGAGAGLSTSAGLNYGGARFQKNFPDFIEKYNLTDMYSAGFYPFASVEEFWAYWSRHIYHNRYEDFDTYVYDTLLSIVKEKEFFVITTNADHLFLRASFPKERLFYTQGDYGLWQCSFPCHEETYSNKERVLAMVKEQKDMRIPQELLPLCPKCGRGMIMNLRCDGSFVQDAGWYAARQRYEDFLHKYQHKKTLYLELGVGENTPAIIKYPFWQWVKNNPQAQYVSINLGEAFCPPPIQAQSLCINADIGAVLQHVHSAK